MATFNFSDLAGDLSALFENDIVRTFQRRSISQMFGITAGGQGVDGGVVKLSPEEPVELEPT